MRGIDISGWQKGINLSAVECDFVIIKATQGRSFISNEFKTQTDQALKLGKKLGFYHYADGCGVDLEANNFINVVKPYLGKAILVLDWEGGGNSKWGDCEYAINLLKKIKELSGITPFIYMSKSYARKWSAHWEKICSEYPLWCAQYANNNDTYYQNDPWTDNKGFGPWGENCAILQYSSHGRLEGYNGNLDINKAFISPEQWDAYAGAHTTENVVNDTPVQNNTKKSNEEIAKEVLAGKWGNGVDRKKNIEAAGYNYTEVQEIVNKLYGSKPEAKTKTVKAKNGLWMHNRAITSSSTRTIAIPYGTKCKILATSGALSKVSCTYRGKTYIGWVVSSYLG